MTFRRELWFFMGVAAGVLFTLGLELGLQAAL